MKNDRNNNHDLTRSRAKARRCMAAWTALVLSLALFPQVAPKFLAWRDGPHDEPAAAPAAPVKKAAPADPNAVRELFVEFKG